MTAVAPLTGKVIDLSGLTIQCDSIQNSDGTTVMASGTVVVAGPADAVVALTDSTGLSGTHDDTLAATAAPVTLTDSTGLSGTHDDTLAATTVPADITGGQSPTEAEHNDLLAVVRIMAQNQSDVAQKIKELVTLVTVMAQNDSDLANKVNDILASLVAADFMTA